MNNYIWLGVAFMLGMLVGNPTLRGSVLNLILKGVRLTVGYLNSIVNGEQKNGEAKARGAD